MVKRYTIKELSSRSPAKYPYAVLENGKVIRHFNTKKDARKYQQAMKKVFSR